MSEDTLSSLREFCEYHAATNAKALRMLNPRADDYDGLSDVYGKAAKRWRTWAELLSESLDLRQAIQISGFDMGPCRQCGQSVVCLPDGLPFCKSCWKSDG